MLIRKCPVFGMVHAGAAALEDLSNAFAEGRKWIRDSLLEEASSISCGT